MAKKKKTGKGESGEKPLTLTRKVQLELFAPEAQEVHVVGDFNHWNTNANPMEKDEKGIWRASLMLRPGRYEYRFIVDGNWENDPSCSSCVPNDFGSKNCVRIVK